MSEEAAGKKPSGPVSAHADIKAVLGRAERGVLVLAICFVVVGIAGLYSSKGLESIACVTVALSGLVGLCVFWVYHILNPTIDPEVAITKILRDEKRIEVSTPAVLTATDAISLLREINMGRGSPPVPHGYIQSGMSAADPNALRQLDKDGQARAFLESVEHVRKHEHALVSSVVSLAQEPSTLALELPPAAGGFQTVPAGPGTANPSASPAE
jgi:hypothetical protein